MKYISLSLRLFFKKPLSNLIIVIELAVAAIALMIVGNIYLYTTNTLSVIQDGNVRVLYYSNANRSLPNSYKSFRQTLKEAEKMFPEIVGYSDFQSDTFIFDSESLLKLNRGEAIEKHKAAETLLIDNGWIENFSLPISNGQWLSSGLTQKGNIPCILGGREINHYSIGDIITAYPLGVSTPGETQLKLEIIGFLAQPAILPYSNISGNPLQVNDIFIDVSNRNLVAIIPKEVVSISDPLTIHASAWIYVDRSCSSQRFDEIRNYLNTKYTNSDEEMIEREQIQIGQTIQIMLPYVTMLFLIVLSGILSATILTSLRNLQTFKIYYLTGASRKNILLLMLFYIFYYFILSSFLFIILLTWLQTDAKQIQPSAMMDAYFIVNIQTLMLIFVLLIFVFIFSFIIPLFILKKNDLSTLLRHE